jgi:hypothetical protein
VRYVDHSAKAKRAILERSAPLAGEMAEEVRAEVVRQMEESVPTGRHNKSHTHTASAPGQPPAIDTRDYIESWKTTEPAIEGNRVTARAYTDLPSGDRKTLRGIYLEFGTDSMEARPHVRPALRKVRPKIKQRVREAAK